MASPAASNYSLEEKICLALKHPFAADALLDTFGPPRNDAVTATEFLAALREPKLRARISPAIFLKWNRVIIPVGAEDVEILKLYANERRAEFDETQRAELDRLLERWQKASDPKVPE